MRGKLFVSDSCFDKVRITPADAGKTCTRKHIARVNGDHPRGCGENTPLNLTQPCALGSPPRMRGKHQ